MIGRAKKARHDRASDNIQTFTSEPGFSLIHFLWRYSLCYANLDVVEILDIFEFAGTDSLNRVENIV